MSPAPSAAACAATHAAIASSFVAPVARIVDIACWSMRAAIAASWSALSWYDADLFATASAATYCLMSSLAARLSMRVWSVVSVE